MPTTTEISLATIDPTWKHAIRVWWSWWWRTTVVSALLGFFFNFWLGMFLATGSAQAVAREIVAIAVSAIVGLYFLKDILDREFPNFRVCLLPRQATASVPEEKPVG